jgi:hypothetical protein
MKERVHKKTGVKRCAVSQLLVLVNELNSNISFQVVDITLQFHTFAI